MHGGIYVHVPFCLSKCPYCDFYSVVGDDKSQRRFVGSIFTEIEKRAETLDPAIKFDTIYFGGGTPTLMGAENIISILTKIKKHLPLCPPLEITVEANPETISHQILADLKSAGVNRLSLGVQSFDDDLLRRLGRVHDARQAIASIAAARAVGYDNISLDLMFGIPGQSMEQWQQTIAVALSAAPQHISAYGLTIEPGTPFHHQLQQGRLHLPNEDTVARMYETLLDLLPGHGYRHYEISNFATAGAESKHNLKYWSGAPYLGLGPAAHSYDGTYRWANVRQLDLYCQKLQQGELPVDYREELDDKQKRREKVLLGLRLVDGIEIEDLQEALDTLALERYRNAGLIEVTDSRIKLTRPGLLVADEVIVGIVAQ